MLIGIDPLLAGEALGLLRDMGHGDRIALVDCNFPAHFMGPPAIRIDTDIVTAGRAILSVMPLDAWIEQPILRMERDGFPSDVMEAHRAFHEMTAETAGQWAMGSLERFRFYEEAQSCCALFVTLERRPYANFILGKGVIGADGQPARPDRPAGRPPAARRARR